MCIYAHLYIKDELLQNFSVIRVTCAASEASEEQTIVCWVLCGSHHFPEKTPPRLARAFFFFLFFPHLQACHGTAVRIAEHYRASWLLEVAVGNDHSLGDLRQQRWMFSRL